MDSAAFSRQFPSFVFGDAFSPCRRPRVSPQRVFLWAPHRLCHRCAPLTRRCAWLPPRARERERERGARVGMHSGPGAMNGGHANNMLTIGERVLLDNRLGGVVRCVYVCVCVCVCVRVCACACGPAARPSSTRTRASVFSFFLFCFRVVLESREKPLWRPTVDFCASACVHICVCACVCVAKRCVPRRWAASRRRRKEGEKRTRHCRVPRVSRWPFLPHPRCRRSVSAPLPLPRPAASPMRVARAFGLSSVCHSFYVSFFDVSLALLHRPADTAQHAPS